MAQHAPIRFHDEVLRRRKDIRVDSGFGHALFRLLLLPERAFQSVLDLAIESLPLGEGIVPNL
jgi:hypothetical protein